MFWPPREFDLDSFGVFWVSAAVKRQTWLILCFLFVCNFKPPTWTGLGSSGFGPSPNTHCLSGAVFARKKISPCRSGSKGVGGGPLRWGKGAGETRNHLAIKTSAGTAFALLGGLGVSPFLRQGPGQRIATGQVNREIF